MSEEQRINDLIRMTQWSARRAALTMLRHLFEIEPREVYTRAEVIAKIDLAKEASDRCK